MEKIIYMEHKIDNSKEKNLLVARQLIAKHIEPTNENILSVWCDLFPADKVRINKALLDYKELFEWIGTFVSNRKIKDCDNRLTEIRRRGEKTLKEKGITVGFGAKMVKCPKDALATYDIFTKGKKYSGNYGSLMRRMGQLPRIDN